MSTVQRIKDGESELLEFNREPDEGAIAVAVAAMLNSEGGRIMVGVDHDGTVVGVHDADAWARKLEAALRRELAPSAPVSVSREPIEGKTILVVDVPVGRDRPYVVGGRIYVRHGGANVDAAPRRIGELVQAPLEPLWGRQPCLGATIADLDLGQVRRVLQSASLSGRWVESDNPIPFMEKLGLIKADQPTNAAVVLFGSQPAAILPQTRVRCAVWAKGAHMIDNRLFEGHIFSLQTQAVQFLRSHIPVSSDLPADTVIRSDTPGVTLGTLREAVVNALAHRDYASYSGSVQIGVHPDRIEIWNAGGLPDGVLLKDLLGPHSSRPRNPDIAHVLYLAGLVEGFGVGTTRILESYQDHTETPSWAEDTGGMRLVMPFRGTPKSAHRDRLNERQDAMISTWRPGHEFTAREYKAAFAPDVSARTVRNDLSKLVDAGYVSQHGSGATTVYQRTERIRAETT